MTIGLPRALLYFRYQYLWETFFKELGCHIALSGETNKKILSDGVKYSIDESCLPSKIYMGHVYSLIGKCDYILVPRIVNYGAKDAVCVKFNAIYDIVKNTFHEARLIDYNLDVVNGHSEFKGFLNMGKILGKSRVETSRAYKKAKRAQILGEKQRAALQSKSLKNEEKLKILIVSHPYNSYDKLLGHPIIEFIKELDGIPIHADACDHEGSIEKSKEFSEHLYWTYNKELIGAIGLLKDRIDGIIFITAFPCGPDSLVNELILRKLKKIPMTNIIVDELQGEAGLQTRIESFMDIIKERRKEVRVYG